MQIEYFQVDAFTDRVFSGNPAGVCLLDKWLPPVIMQKIAFENNLSETAFIVKDGKEFSIRWFTPTVEIDLCGHATLASAHIIFHHLCYPDTVIHFRSTTDYLSVEKKESTLFLNFPAHPPHPCEIPAELVRALGQKPVEVLASRDYLVVFDSEDTIRNLKPDMSLLSQLDKFGVIITARGKTVDFVSRFFAPAQGIPEDPVTGSAHCTLIPFWSKRLSRTSLTALQLSHRGGKLLCYDLGQRVLIGGRAVTYLHGYIEVQGV